MRLSNIGGIILIMVGAVISQKVAANASARLDDATKLRIAEIFPKRNVNYNIIVFAMIIAFLFASYFFPNHLGIILLLYSAVFTLYIVSKLVINVRTLRKISAPNDYISSIQMSFIAFIGGAILRIGIIAVASLD